MADDERVRKVFFAAIELESAEREKFVRTACGEDLGLRREVNSLLETHDRGGEFLEVPALNFSAGELTNRILETEEASAVGRLVGAYRIESEIGRGGMGSVYLATRADQVFTKHVAIKLLRRGTENQSVVRRFEKERQVLADLEHPHIARLIDGGTTENGMPYFVMEYVAGRPIDQFCDERRLSARERLELFRQVCTAVEFAHEHSIIHRDLKPGNILVSDKGAPKLLDFGIAKSSNSGATADSTATAFRLMTPEYASPEQMRGDPVGKATDIYSLGVVLYQLITGHRPYELDKKSPFEIVKAICEEVPAAPSSIPRSVEQAPPAGMRGELDKIILKSLRKIPTHRYGSVREFADDIGRLLDGAPVQARREPLLERSAQFYRRNRLAARSAIAVSLLLVLFAVWFGFRNRSLAVVNSPETRVPKPTRPIALDDRRRGGTDNAEARGHYLKAQELWESRTQVGLTLARELFQSAIDRDPNFALAYSGLSNCYFLLSVWGTIPAQEAFPKARAASMRAITLAPAVSEGHLSLAMVHWLYEYDWLAADTEFKKAIELDPDYGRAPHWYGLFLAEMGRSDEAFNAEKRAMELEPDSVPVKADFARVLYYARRYDESLVQYQKVISAYPAFAGFYFELSELYEALGMTDEFLALHDRLNGRPKAEVRTAYAREGMRGIWRLQIKYVGDRSNEPIFYTKALAYARLGQYDLALAAIERAIAIREHRIAQLKVDPRFDVMRSHPRFIALLKRLRLDG